MQTSPVCGRYVAAADKSVISEQFNAVPVTEKTLAPDYNVAPSKSVYAVVNRHDERQLRVLRWGLIPSWAKDPKIGNRMANARLETAAEKPSFRRAFAKRRAILPADGYYEWYTPDKTALPPGGKVRKQPYYIHPTDGSLMAMAALYEIWRDPSVDDENDPDAFRWTCTILTTTATDELGRIHDRMPLLVARDNFADWLDPANSAPQPGLLVPAVPGLLEAYPISTEVNSVRNNGPELLAPLADTN